MTTGVHRRPALNLGCTRRLWTRPELWEYSNYQEWLQLRPGTLADRAFVQAHFPDIKRYERSVLDYLGGRLSLPEKLCDYLLGLEV